MKKISACTILRNYKNYLIRPKPFLYQEVNWFISAVKMCILFETLFFGANLKWTQLKTFCSFADTLCCFLLPPNGYVEILSPLSQLFWKHLTSYKLIFLIFKMRIHCFASHQIWFRFTSYVASQLF